MGHAPPRPIPSATRLEVERARYVSGLIGVEAFEARVEQMLSDGTSDAPAGLRPPRWGMNTDMAEWLPAPVTPDPAKPQRF